MSIPENILQKLKCCVSNPEHYIHEPVQLNCCSRNACKACIKNLNEEFKCNCQRVNKKIAYLNATTNETAEVLKETFIKPIMTEIEQKSNAIEILLNGNIIEINKSSNINVFKKKICVERLTIKSTKLKMNLKLDRAHSKWRLIKLKMNI